MEHIEQINGLLNKTIIIQLFSDTARVILFGKLEKNLNLYCVNHKYIKQKTSKNIATFNACFDESKIKKILINKLGNHIILKSLTSKNIYKISITEDYYSILPLSIKTLNEQLVSVYINVSLTPVDSKRFYYPQMIQITGYLKYNSLNKNYYIRDDKTKSEVSFMENNVEKIARSDKTIIFIGI